MKIATWNINSVRARLGNVTSWLQTAQPDVLLLQEIKCEAEAFPRLEFEALSYHLAMVGQKSYNGVAIISRHPLTNIIEKLPNGEADEQARYVEATIQACRIACLYLPNGNPIDSEKYPYKLSWMKRLYDHAEALLKLEVPVIFGGDFNVIPTAADVYDPQNWEQDALFRPETRAAFQRLINLGYTDAYRALHPQQQHAYTFWDYQAGAWQRDNGLRIDHFLLSPEAVDRLVSCTIDRQPRGLDKASDHTPVIVEINA